MKKGIKHDTNKPPLNLLPPKALIAISRVLAHGAAKYDSWNWKGGLSYSRLVAASLRHICAFNDGEDLDPESGISHIAHAACGLLFLLDFIEDGRGLELDDRYKGENK